MIQKILYPTDLTGDSKKAVGYAHRLAQRNHTQLVVFHVLSLPSVWLYPCESEIYCEQWQRMLAEFRVDKLLADGELKVKGFVVDALKNASRDESWKPRVALGKVAEEIITAAMQEEVGLIVMSRCQRSWPLRVLTRGVVEKVSRNAPCPVLLLDRGRADERFEGWRLPVLEEVPSY
jgi:nucleotide-binding universal stress UspA family protein